MNPLKTHCCLGLACGKDPDFGLSGGAERFSLSGKHSLTAPFLHVVERLAFCRVRVLGLKTTKHIRPQRCWRPGSLDQRAAGQVCAAPCRPSAGDDGD